MVAEVSHVLLAARLSSAAGVGRTHVGGDLADNVADSHLVLDHLVVAVLLGDGAEVQVSPGVRGKLVAFGIHALDDFDELRGKIDLSLVDVVSSDEESSLGVVGSHDIKDVAGENLLWAVIVGDSNRSWGSATVDAVASVLDISKLGASDRGSVGTARSLVLWAARAVLVIAARGVAVVILGSAV